jgi:tetratricopeptide (TPR) repeat protein
MSRPPIPPPVSDKLAQAMSAAVAAHQHGRLDDARGLYAKVLRTEPNHFPALYLLGVVHLQGGQAREALKPLAAAVKANPASIDAWSSYGVALAMAGEHVPALDALDRTLLLAPRHTGALMNRGNVLSALGRHGEAVESFERAIALDPGNPEIANNRGNALCQLGRYDEALTSYDRALALKADYVPALENRGNALIVLNRNDEALASYRRALAIRPDYADARYAESFVLLRLGELQAGFRQYEWRWQRSELASYRRDLGKPLWLGEAPLSGKTILLHAEQGFGDTIQFIRYARLIARMDAAIVLEVQPAVKRLLAPLAQGGTTIGRGEALPPFDCHCPLLSLPLAFGTELASVPADIPYVSPPGDRIGARWHDRIAAGGRRKVGIVWSGNPSFRNDRNRSMVLADVAPLLASSDAAFVSLNPGLAPQDVSALAAMAGVVHPADEFRDFADTAAVVAGLDLVIATDTAVAHLAGAMGKPVWILLSYGPDWRWLTDREDCPWYPTARLFRQPKIGDWASVIERVREQLAIAARARIP